jgi:hypothetical protein
LGKKLCEELGKIKADGAGKGVEVEVHESGTHAKAVAKEIGSLAVLADAIEVWRTSPPSGVKNVESLLEAQARDVEGRVDYLLERFKTVEFDRGAKVIQMRSSEPQPDKGQLFYYELMLTGGWKASLRRCRSEEGVPGREGVAVNLTLEVLERLIDDLAGVLK